MSRLRKLFPLKELPRKSLNQLRQHPAFQHLVTPLGYPLEPDRWIFVVGCYNSGTTLLAEILSAHPQIGGLPIEGVGLTDALPRPEEYGWVRMWAKCLDQVRLDPGPEMHLRAERIKRQWSIWYPNEAPNLLEKSIANTTRMPFLQTYFQPAYFIHIVRNGYAVAEGIRRKSDLRRWGNPVYRERYPIDLCAEQWRASDELVERERPKIDRFLQVYYEDMTSDPRGVLDQVTAFLGLPALPTSTMDRDWSIHGVQSRIRNMNERSFFRLTADEIECIRQVADKALDKHGYGTPSTSRSDVSASR